MGRDLLNSSKLTSLRSKSHLHKQKRLSSLSSVLAREGYAQSGEQVSRHVQEKQSIEEMTVTNSQCSRV